MANNNNSNKTTVSSGIGFTGLLTIVFIVLKLIGVISWSWVWVLAPIWISWSLVILIILIALVGAVLSKDKDEE